MFNLLLVLMNSFSAIAFSFRLIWSQYNVNFSQWDKHTGFSKQCVRQYCKCWLKGTWRLLLKNPSPIISMCMYYVRSSHAKRSSWLSSIAWTRFLTTKPRLTIEFNSTQDTHTYSALIPIHNQDLGPLLSYWLFTVRARMSTLEKKVLLFGILHGYKRKQWQSKDKPAYISQMSWQ